MSCSRAGDAASIVSPPIEGVDLELFGTVENEHVGESEVVLAPGDGIIANAISRVALTK